MSQHSTTKSRIGHRARYGKFYFGLLVSVLCIVWVIHSVEEEKVTEELAGADFSLLSLAVLTTLLGYILRAIRWPYFFGERAPDLSTSFRCLITGFFMNNVLPARMGEFVRAHTAGRATQQSRTIVLATIAAERIADGLVISLLFALLFPLAQRSGSVQGGNELYYVVYAFIVAAIGTGVVLVMRHKLFELLEKMGSIMPGHLSTYTLTRIRRFIHGLEPLLRPKKLIVLSLLSILVWGVELLAYYQVAEAFGQDLSLGGLSLFLAAVNFSSLIPAGPGGIGVIEVFAPLALKTIGIEHHVALSMVVAQHMIQYLVVGVPGSLLFFWHLGGKIPEESEFNEEDESTSSSLGYSDVSGPKRIDGLIDQENEILNDQDLDNPLDLSIVIPAYNEEFRLPKTLLSIIEFLRSRKSSFEILVVDDGSTDNTSGIVQKFSTISPEVRLLVYPHNRGKGYAVRFGMLNARGRLLLLDDADGATPIEELDRLEAAIEQGAQIAIGSRAMFSRETEVQTSWHRKLMGRVFNGLVNVILLPGIADTQCGFKLFTRPVARHLFSRQRSEGFSFDCEILFLARKSGCQIAEVPVNWTNVAGSKVNLLKDSFLMLVDLIRFRFRKLVGGYGELTYKEEPSHSSEA